MTSPMDAATRSSPTGRARPFCRCGDGCPSARSSSSRTQGSLRFFFIAALRRHVTFVTRLRLDANRYEPAPPRQPGKKGRPPKTGPRLPKLCDVLANKKTRWTKLVMPYWYGDETRCVLEFVTGTALWNHSGLPPAPLRWVLVRDPIGVRNPQAFLCTDLDIEPAVLLGWFVSRWSMETFLSGKPRTSRRRDAAAMVRRRHRANDPSPVRHVLADDAMGRRPQNHPKPAAALDGLVSQERTHLQRRHRRRSQAILGHSQFINVPDRPRQRGNSARTLEQTQRDARLRRIKCAKSSLDGRSLVLPI